MSLPSTNPTPAVSASGFVFKTLLWLPLTFYVWYIAAVVFSFPAAFLADMLLPLVLPGVVDGVEQQRYLADVVTTLNAKAANGNTGQFIFTLNLLKYGYGFPLIIAMILATPDSAYNKLDNMTYGFAVVALAQTWGVCFEALSFLLLKAGGDLQQQMLLILPFADNDWLLNGVALGYQLGFLILPAVVPIVFWVLRNQTFLGRLASK